MGFMFCDLHVFSQITCIFYCQTTPILKTLGQFEDLVFVIMSTRENIRLIARTPLFLKSSVCNNINYTDTFENDRTKISFCLKECDTCCSFQCNREYSIKYEICGKRQVSHSVHLYLTLLNP